MAYLIRDLSSNIVIITNDSSSNVIISTGNTNRVTISNTGVWSYQGGMSYNNATNALTATTFIGDLSGNTTNIAGGAGGQILYQSSANTTAKLANGTAGQVLTSAGGTSAPTWTTPSSGGSAPIYANFNVNLQGFNKKQRFILPSAKTITSSTITGKIDGIMGGAGGVGPLQQSYYFGNYVAARTLIGGQIGGSSIIQYSNNGRINTWQNSTSPFGGGQFTLALFWTGTRWLAGGGDSGANTLAYSADGITWTGLGNSIFSVRCSCFAMSDGGRILAGGQGTNGLAYSDDGGLTWTGLGTSPFNNTLCLTWYGGQYNGPSDSVYVAGGTYGAYYSYNGLSWFPVNFGAGGITTCRGLAFNGTYLFACGQSATTQLIGRGSFANILLYPQSGGNVNWCLCWNGNVWVCGAYTGLQRGGYYSYDGTTWTEFPANSNATTATILQVGLKQIIWDGTKFIGTAETAILISYNGINWELSLTGLSSSGLGTPDTCVATNNFRRPNTLTINQASSPNAVATIVGGSLTTSDLEIVENQFFCSNQYSNFSVRID